MPSLISRARRGGSNWSTAAKLPHSTVWRRDSHRLGSGTRTGEKGGKTTRPPSSRTLANTTRGPVSPLRTRPCHAGNPPPRAGRKIEIRDYQGTPPYYESRERHRDESPASRLRRASPPVKSHENGATWGFTNVSASSWGRSGERCRGSHGQHTFGSIERQRVS